MEKDLIICDLCKREKEKGGFGGMPWIKLSLPINSGYNILELDFCKEECLMNYLYKTPNPPL